MKTYAPNRRQFLRHTVAAAGAAGISLPIISSARGADSPAPSDKITIGCIGVGGMGTGNMKVFVGLPGCRVVAVCDAYEDRRQRAKSIVDDNYGNQRLPDVRRLPRTAGPRGHRRGDDRPAGPLARPRCHGGGQGGEGHVLREAAGRVASRRGGGSATRSAGPSGCSRPAPGSGPRASSSRPANWSATATWARSTRSKSPPRAPSTAPATKGRWTRSRSRPASIGRCGADRRPRSPTIRAAWPGPIGT